MVACWRTQRSSSGRQARDSSGAPTDAQLAQGEPVRAPFPAWASLKWGQLQGVRCSAAPDQEVCARLELFAGGSRRAARFLSQWQRR